MAKSTSKEAVKPAEEAGEQAIELARERRLELTRAGDDQTLEIRAPGGEVELRITLTEAGPVLQLDAVKLAISARDSVEVDCGRFEVRARESVVLESEGDTELTTEGETRVSSTANVVIKGEYIYLN